MVETTRFQRCSRIGEVALGILFPFVFLLLLPCRGWCSSAEYRFDLLISQNVVQPSVELVSPEAVLPISGGGILDDPQSGQPFLVGDFGNSFAGYGYFPDIHLQIVARAQGLYESGAEFLRNDNIIRMALVTDLNDLDGTYNEAELIAAEVAYRQLLYIDPFNPDAVTGILETRWARVLKLNLEWDIRRREQLRKRLTLSAPIPDLTGEVLSGEIDILSEISDLMREAVTLLLELYADPQLGGPGSFLRGEFTIDGSDAIYETQKLLFSSGRRFAEGHLDLAQKRLLLGFFDEGQGESSRSFALAELENANAFVTELQYLLGPFVKIVEPQPGQLPNDSIFLTTDAARLPGFQARLAELAGMIQQGYNVFGFLPDFVPFLPGSQEDNNLSTFNALHGIATTYVGAAQTAEDTAETTENQFATSSAQYKQRMLDLETGYGQRLETLVGKVVTQQGPQPDIFTFRIPDVDLDGDGISERDKERAILQAQNSWIFGSKGRIGLQYEQIAAAELRVENAKTEIRNNFREIEIREQTARDFWDIATWESKLVLDTGERVSLLAREKGRLQKTAALESAEEQKRGSLFGWAYEEGKEFLQDLRDNIGFGPLPLTMSETHPEGIVFPKWVQYVIAASAGIANAGFANNSVGAIGEIQGQLAEDMANIDAQIVEIQAMQQSDLILAEGRKELLRTEEEVQLLVLKRANLELDLQIAKRDLTREMKEIYNLNDETLTLITDMARLMKLTEEDLQGNAIGWVDEDVRDVLTNNVLVADKAFFRAQVWSFIALRALEYYANRPPESDGQPYWQIRDLYYQNYRARRASDLTEVLNTMNAKAISAFIFTDTSTACPEVGMLSLKYDVFCPTRVQYSGTGQPTEGGVENEVDYRYTDPTTGIEYSGKRAYLAAFRDTLRQGLEGSRPTRKLTLVFATDLFPRLGEVGYTGYNPFYVASARNAKIAGFTDSSCAGPGVPENAQGVQVNLTGDLSLTHHPRVKLGQMGNSYLKHSQWGGVDFDQEGRLIDPLGKLTVYSSYRQELPSWLVGDTYDPNDRERETIGSDVYAVFTVLLNGLGPAGKTLAFTDRAVANDRWELRIDELEASANTQFFDKLQIMLNSPVPSDVSTEFLTDIQLWIGWAYREPSTFLNASDEE